MPVRTLCHYMQPGTDYLGVVAKLSEKSEVFADMFDLQHIGSPNGHPGAETNGNIILQDDPGEFALLLDVLYHGMWVTLSSFLSITDRSIIPE